MHSSTYEYLKPTEDQIARMGLASAPRRRPTETFCKLKCRKARTRHL